MELMTPQIGVAIILGIVLVVLAYLERQDDGAPDDDVDLLGGRSRERQRTPSSTSR